MPEAARPTLGPWQHLDRLEADALDPLDHELRYAIAADHLVVGIGVGIHQEHPQLVSVTAVDQPRRVEAGHTVAQCQPAARLHETSESLGQGHGYPRRNQGASPSPTQLGVLASDQIGAGITG
jgi:hypothetical protein